jgi:S1-C subfamily serine protease
MRNISKNIIVFFLFLGGIFLATFLYVFFTGKLFGKNYLSLDSFTDFFKRKEKQAVVTPPPEPQSKTTCSEEETLKRTKLCTFLIGDIEKHGTGFLISPEGYLVTNYHVINHSEDGYADVFYQGDFHRARIVNFSIEDDLALLKIASGFTDCQWAKSKTLQLAETVYAVGWPKSPYGESTITKGVFSRYVSLGDEQEGTGIPAIQTDTPINPGNSGGPLINACGVVGINTSKVSWIDANAPSEGIGYAIASDYAQGIINDFIKKDSGEPKIPPLQKESEPVSEQTEEKAVESPASGDPVSYDFDQVIFWEQRMINDEAFLKSWRSAQSSENLDEDKLRELIALAERSLEISKELWDGYTNSKITYGEVLRLKQEYLLLSKRMSFLANELNISGSINAYKSCLDSWEKLEEEYNRDFSEQKEECDNIIDF